jgi:hypothetical protein
MHAEMGRCLSSEMQSLIGDAFGENGTPIDGDAFGVHQGIYMYIPGIYE